MAAPCAFKRCFGPLNVVAHSCLHAAAYSGQRLLTAYCSRPSAAYHLMPFAYLVAIFWKSSLLSFQKAITESMSLACVITSRFFGGSPINALGAPPRTRYLMPCFSNFGATTFRKLFL